MIIDSTLMMSDKQAITSGTVLSTNVIDFGERGKVPPHGGQIVADMGYGEKIPLLVQATESFAGLTSLAISVQTSDAENFSPHTTLITEAIPVAKLKAGDRISLPVVPYNTTGRYMRMSYTATGTATAGKITACITMGNDETYK